MKILSVHSGHANIRLTPVNYLAAIRRLLACPLVESVTLQDRSREQHQKHSMMIGERRPEMGKLGTIAARLRAPPGIGMGWSDFEMVVRQLEQEIEEMPGQPRVSTATVTVIAEADSNTWGELT